ncbi:MAG: hypothetical protein AB1556_07510 [Bacillota bacterium]
MLKSFRTWLHEKNHPWYIGVLISLWTLFSVFGSVAFLAYHTKAFLVLVGIGIIYWLFSGDDDWASAYFWIIFYAMGAYTVLETVAYFVAHPWRFDWVYLAPTDY